MEDMVSLVRAAQDGDMDAFGQIIKRFQDMAFAVAYARLGDPHLAEDAAQEAFIEAYLNLAKLEEPAAFPGWLRTIVVRQSNRLTRGKRLPAVPLEESTAVSSVEQSPVASAERRELQDIVHEAIKRLPESERQVTLLFYIADHSQKEIANFLGLRVSTVKSRLYAARTHLRERMIEMVQDNLQEQRPSRDDTFVSQVMGLIKAADAGDAAKVAVLLKENPDLVDAKGAAPYATRALRPLHFALGYGHREVIEELLASGADVNAKPDESWAPLHYALSGGHRDLAEELIARGAKVDIFAAAQLGDLEQIKAFLEDTPDLVQAKGPDGATPLHLAATAPVAQLLLDYGANLEARDEVRQSMPLSWQARNPAVAQFLLAQGAAVDDIFLACQVGAVEQVQAFLDADPALVQARKDERDTTPLHAAAYCGHVEVARLLLARGADVNAKAEAGSETPLHNAAGWGHPEMVHLLVDHGADLNARDTEFNSTPLGWAKFFKREAVVIILEELGATT